MGAPASSLDELDSSCMLHALGTLAIDLQDFISDLQKKRKRTRKVKEEKDVGRRWEPETGDR